VTYEPSLLTRDGLGVLQCAFFAWSGTPTLNNPITPTLVGSSSGFTPTISGNDIELPPGEYLMRGYVAITRTTTSSNLVFQWREVGGSLLGENGATNRELSPGTVLLSLDSVDAHLTLASPGSVQLEMTQVDSGITLDTTNSHAMIWRLPQ